MVFSCTASVRAGAEIPTLEQLDADKSPVAGSKILSVKKSSIAERLGMRKDDVVVAIDEEPVTSDIELSRIRDRNEPNQIHIYRPGIGMYVIDAPAGILGFQTSGIEHVTLAVSRDMQRNPVWNQFVIETAHWLEDGDPQRAQQAFKRVVESGYPEDVVLEALRWHVAVANGNDDMAWEIFQGLPRRDERRIYLPDEHKQFNVAIASGHYQEAAMIGAAPDVLRWREWRDWVKDLPRDEVFGAGEDTLARMRRRRINDTLVPARRWVWGREMHSLDTDFRTSQTFRLASSPGYYRQAFLTREEGLRDFLLEGEFTVKPVAEPHPQWANNLLISFADYDQEVGAEQSPDYFEGRYALLGMAIWQHPDNSVVRAFMGWETRRPISNHRLTEDTKHTVSISRVGQRGRIVFDGVTLADLPVDADMQNLVFHLHSVGLAVEFHHLDLFELDAGE